VLPWLEKVLPEWLKGLFLHWRPQKKPVFSRTKVDYIYSHFLGQNHVRKGGRKKICRTHFSVTVTNRSDAKYILEELTLWLKIGEKTHRFRLYDEERRKCDVPYTLESHTIYTFSYNAVPEGFTVWPGQYDGTLPFSNKDEMQFYATYRSENGRTHEILIENLRRMRFNPELIANYSFLPCFYDYHRQTYPIRHPPPTTDESHAGHRNPFRLGQAL
jgi:hypothetical protein